MTSNIDALAVRRRLGRKDWSVPQEYGPDGWAFRHLREPASIIVSYGPVGDSKQGWLHASIARRDQMPSYEDLVRLHYAVWGGEGWAYQVFAPTEHHVNIHPNALHLWGRLDGTPELPNFGAFGTI